jgi:hypothetical protein
MKQKQITPLPQWPTEAILYLFRKNRTCFTSGIVQYYERKNKLTNKNEIWLPVGGVYQIDDDHWDYDVLYYELFDGTKEEYLKQHTQTYGHWDTDEITFRFEGMYWRGSIREIKKELQKRPHCNIHSSKDFRKWKMNWKKNNKR